MPDTIILIPARMASSRLPGKPLADIAGLPMIVHVLRRALAAKIGEAVVATDSEAVAAAVEKSGGRAIMTRADHVSGSDRIYEALEALDPKHRIGVVVNVQGDLPTIEPADIRAALERFVKLPPSANEQREKLEQLRALDAGMRIDVAIVKSVPLGVDTPEELAKARQMLAR